MKTLFLSVFLLSGGLSFCQTSIYHPFPTNNVVWNYDASPGCFSSYPTRPFYKFSVMMKGDTLIGNLMYKKLVTDYLYYNWGSCIDYETGYQGAIRVDNLNKKVYKVWPNDTSPNLIYDFNLKVGDSLLFYKPVDLGSQEDGIVQSIDSVLVEGSYRRRWNIGVCTPVSYIEGIGMTTQSPPCIVDGPSSFTLTCMKTGIGTIFPDGNEPCNLITSTNEAFESKPEVRIFPIPSQGSIKIELSNSSFEKMELIDMVGKTVLQKSITETPQTELANLPKGVFILSLTGKGAKGFSRKVTVL